MLTFGSWGNLDYSSGGGSAIPSSIVGSYVQVAAGNFALYTLDAGGAIVGYGRVFVSGVGPVPAGTSTISVPSTTLSALPTNAGFAHACAIDAAGDGICWGADYAGQVRDAPSSQMGPSYIYPALQGELCDELNRIPTLFAHRLAEVSSPVDRSCVAVTCHATWHLCFPST